MKSVVFFLIREFFYFLFVNRWVNRKDFLGKNIFGGGFFGFDNIGE